MAHDELIDSHVSVPQCSKAVTALVKHAVKSTMQKEEHELLPGKEEFVWLVVNVKKTYPEKKLKPFKIPLKHPLIDPRTTAICLITKDPQREYKDLLAEHNVKFISRVVGVTKLKGKFRPFEARRLLLKENGMFLADERVVPLLPGLLGKKFFEAKKQPIPVCLTRKDLKGELERAVSSSYMHQNQGTCTSVKVGTISQEPVQLLANLKIALPSVVKHIQGGWDNVQSLNIKTNSSIALPIWTCELGRGEGARWAETQDGDDEWSGFDSSGDKVETIHTEDSEKAIVKPAEKKGKKRSAEEGSETTPKKAKQRTTESTSGKEKGVHSESTSADGQQKDTIPKSTPKSAKSVRIADRVLKPTTPSTAVSTTIITPKSILKKTNSNQASMNVDVPTDDDTPAPAPRSTMLLSRTKSNKLKRTDASSPSSAPAVAHAAPNAKALGSAGRSESTPSAKELKHKLSSAGLAKKKDKIVNGKLGKGVKESILGRASNARA